MTSGPHTDDSFFSGTAVWGPGGSAQSPAPPVPFQATTLSGNWEAPQETQAAGTPPGPLANAPSSRLPATESLTRSSSSRPRALPRLASTTCPGPGRAAGGAGTGRQPHTACCPHRRWGPPRGTWGSSLQPEGPESQPDELPAASPSPGPPHRHTTGNARKHRTGTVRGREELSPPRVPGPQDGPPSRPWVWCRHWPRGFRQVRRQGAPQGW